MAVRLFVGNLPYDATEDEIRQHFSSVGNLSYVSIPLDRETGKKRGFAFVEFADPRQAQEAIRQFNNQPFKGRPLAVNEARAREAGPRSEEHTSELQSRLHLVCRLLLVKKDTTQAKAFNREPDLC